MSDDLLLLATSSSKIILRWPISIKKVGRRTNHDCPQEECVKVGLLSLLSAIQDDRAPPFLAKTNESRDENKYCLTFAPKREMFLQVMTLGAARALSRHGPSA